MHVLPPAPAAQEAACKPLEACTASQPPQGGHTAEAGEHDVDRLRTHEGHHGDHVRHKSTRQQRAAYESGFVRFLGSENVRRRSPDLPERTNGKKQPAESREIAPVRRRQH